MSELGVSIYPSKSTFEEMVAYLNLASELGYRRVFTSMLEVTNNPENTLDYFKKLLLIQIV